MKLSFDQKLGANDLSYAYLERMKSSVEESIKENKELMDEVEANVIEDADGEGLTQEQIKNRVGLKVDEAAQAAVDSIKLYVEFDVEVKL